MKRFKMEWLKHKWDYDNCLVVDYVGRAGGLALSWSAEVQVDVNSYSTFHINMKVSGNRIEDTWHFTRFYGHHQT